MRQTDSVSARTKQRRAGNPKTVSPHPREVYAMKTMQGVVICMFLLAVGCVEERASLADCQKIFDRLVFLELEEMGFRDPLLVETRQTDLRARYREQLNACVGRRLPPGALQCVASAKTAESVSHDCLH